MGLLAAGALAWGCASDGLAPPRPAPSSAGDALVPADETVALLNGRPVPWSTLRARLAEAAGGPVLEEVVLDQLIDAQAARAGVTVTDAEVAAEAAALAEAMRAGAGLSAEASGPLLDRLRAERGLGPIRYRALLRRNALLRKLVAPDVQIAEEEIVLAHRIRRGERRVTRAVVFPTAAEAAAARAQIDATQAPDRPTRFAAMASTLASDAGVPAGGLLGPISQLDPAYPQALRDAVYRTTPGEVTPIVGLDQRFALALVERVLPAESVPIEADRGELERELRRRRERLAMQELADRLSTTADLRVLDAGIRWSRGTP